jgi:DNA-binding response OmpR family regulator
MNMMTIVNHEQIKSSELYQPHHRPLRGKVFEAEVTKKHVLIIDDDRNAKTFWKHLLLSTLPGVTIDWATSAAAGEKMIKSLKGDPYDLVISSFWLEGAIQLWKRMHRTVRNYIFVSDLPLTPRELKDLLDKGYPIYLQKPFSESHSRRVISSLCDLNISFSH